MKLVLDTSVLVEYIVRNAPYRRAVQELFERASSGELGLYITPITLSETLYVTSRIYQAASIPNPNQEALNYIIWLTTKTKVLSMNEDIALRAGEIKKTLHIALPDCYVIAAAEAVNAVPLFKKLEKEMEPVKDKLAQLKVRFLEEHGTLTG